MKLPVGMKLTIGILDRYSLWMFEHIELHLVILMCLNKNAGQLWVVSLKNSFPPQKKRIQDLSILCSCNLDFHPICKSKLCVDLCNIFHKLLLVEPRPFSRSMSSVAKLDPK